MPSEEDIAQMKEFVRLIKAAARERRRMELKVRIAELNKDELAEYMQLAKEAKTRRDDNDLPY